MTDADSPKDDRGTDAASSTENRRTDTNPAGNGTPGSDSPEPDTPEERLRPFEGVRLSKGTDRVRGLKALVQMLRRREEEP